jgi:hypothetical protein
MEAGNMFEDFIKKGMAASASVAELTKQGLAAVAPVVAQGMAIGGAAIDTMTDRFTTDDKTKIAHDLGEKMLASMEASARGDLLAVTTHNTEINILTNQLRLMVLGGK